MYVVMDIDVSLDIHIPDVNNYSVEAIFPFKFQDI